jgi:hypothetical protein
MSRKRPVIREEPYVHCVNCTNGWLMVGEFAKRCPCWFIHQRRLLDAREQEQR